MPAEGYGVDYQVWKLGLGPQSQALASNHRKAVVGFGVHDGQCLLYAKADF